MRKYTLPKIIEKILLVFIVFVLGTVFGSSGLIKKDAKSPSYTSNQDKYTIFLGEVYDKIKENYWETTSDGQLVDIYRLAATKFLGGDTATSGNTKEDLFKAIQKELRQKDEKSKKEIVANIASSVLSGLNPIGRSGLYTQKLETQLKNNVENVNPDKDLYKDLGVAKNSSPEAVMKAFDSQAEDLKKQNTPEANKKLEQISYAKEVLTNNDKKQRYDEKGVEPTIFSKSITPDIAYIRFSKFSPTSLDEFQKAFNSFNNDSGPASLIFDLRGNIGGAIDALPYFMGNFLGVNQYAYDFYHQGQYQPFKTMLDKLPSITRFKQMVILIDNQTQSSAELMAASLKRYNKGIVVGVPSKGWGTVERVFPLDNQIDQSEKYSVFLVHSITLRDDNQPIEGRGVEPTVNIKEEGWENKLQSYLRYPQLSSAVKQVLSEKP